MENDAMKESRVSVEKLETLMPLILERLSTGQAITFSPMGQSMMPMLRQKIDTVTLSPIRAPLKKYDLPLYQRANGKYVLHRIVEVGERFTCIGDNQFIYERGLCREQMIGVVTAFTRAGKEHSVDEAGYQLYCRLWHHSRRLRRIYRAIIRRIKKLTQK